MRVAVARWRVEVIATEAQFWDRLNGMIQRALAECADLLVLPENVTFELLALKPDLEEPDFPAFLADYAETYRAAVTRDDILIVGGSTYVRRPSGITNECPVAGVWTPKMVLTQYEVAPLGLAAGQDWVQPDHPELGVAICYDSEFGPAARNLAEEGRRVLAIPAFTETQRGFQRVRWCALARAVEHQIFVLHSSLGGSLGREPLPESCGTSAIIAPSVAPFPESAILAETGPEEHGLALADLDFDALEQARAEGDVRNWEDRHRSGFQVRRDFRP